MHGVIIEGLALCEVLIIGSFDRPIVQSSHYMTHLVLAGELLVGDLGVIVDGVSLGHQAELVTEGVEESNDGEGDWDISSVPVVISYCTHTWTRRDPRYRSPVGSSQSRVGKLRGSAR